MHRRSWPWKKKSSEKTLATTDSDNIEGGSFVQISTESYAHLTELEEQVQDLNEKLSSAHKSLSSAQSEVTAKDILVKQHAKVADEAVSGWEKAEAEALALKHQLETVTLLKLTAEERASHLDGALKECMIQIRNVKEEGEQKLQDVIFAKTTQWEKIHVDLQAKITSFEQELLRTSAENAAISRSLQERSSMLMKISEQKSQADAEIEVLKDTIQSYKKEINSFEYELHIASKELEIRTEEKNMSMRSAEVANKHHLEDVKKITKLEAECQRLRGLVRKKLPGPAALAQMKVEVESLGRDYGESRMRPSPARGSSPRHLSFSDRAFEDTQQCRKENELLTARLVAMEEETVILKEALSRRNSELQDSRNMCTKTMNKLQSLEAHVAAYNQQKSPSKPSTGFHFDNGSNQLSLTSMSEDGIDEEGSCSESWATTLIKIKSSKADHLELMDDFLEMERLACLSTESNGTITLSEGIDDIMKSANGEGESLVDIPENEGRVERQTNSETPTNQASCNEETHSKAICEQNHRDKATKDFTSGEVSREHDISSHTDIIFSLDQELKNAISQIYDSVVSLGKEAAEIHGLSKKIDEFSSSVKKVLCNELHLHDFILALSHILSEATELGSTLVRDKRKEGDINSSECIDKIPLLENKLDSHEPTKDRLLRVCSSSDVEIEEAIGEDIQLKTNSQKYSPEEFEQLKMEKESMLMDLDETKQKLVETEQHLSELKSKLAASEKSNSLSETQLKCMAESYKSLELRTQELELHREHLETEINVLRTKAEVLDNELQEERHSHQADLVKYNELKERSIRDEESTMCSFLPDIDSKTKQEKEIAAAAEKLAECQETMLLLGRQLKAMHPLEEVTGFSPISRHRMSDCTLGDISGPRGSYNDGIEDGESPVDGHDSHLSASDTEAGHFPRLPMNSKRQKHRSSGSSSSSSSNALSEKSGHTFSRFFSKGRKE